MRAGAERSPRDEAADVLRCLSETLREPGFATALILLVYLAWDRAGDANQWAACKSKRPMKTAKG